MVSNQESMREEIPLCEDIIIDALKFLTRNEHQSVNLVNWHFHILSELVIKRYPPRIISPLMEIKGITNESGVFIGNSMRLCPLDDFQPPYYVNIPDIEPPASIMRFTELEISDYISEELFRLLTLSRRLFECSWIKFSDFDNFVRFHSIEFINAFLRLFTSNNSIELQKISNHTEHLFSSPELLECCDLAVECAEDFNLTNLHNWLHLYPVQFGKKRFLSIRFCDQVHEGKRVDSVKQFIQIIVEQFISSTKPCPFSVEIELLDGPHIPDIPNIAMENDQSGEILNMIREHRIYTITRTNNEGDEQHLGNENERYYDSVIYIRELQRGDIPM